MLIFKAARAPKTASTPVSNIFFVRPIAFATTLDFQLLNVTIVFHGLPLQTAHCCGGLGEAHLNPPRHKSLVYATAGVFGVSLLKNPLHKYM